MTIAETAEKLQTQRRELAAAVASQILDDLPAKWQEKLEAKVMELLLAPAEGFDTDAASAFVAEKCSEWASLPGQEHNRHHGRTLADAMAGQAE